MTQRSAVELLERTIAIVPWVASQPGGWATFDEIADRFELSPDEAQACLTIASMVGVAPYTPDALIDVIIEPDGVMISLPEFFRRPLRPTPEQTFALLATTKALSAVDGSLTSGPLRSASAKVLASLGSEAAPLDIALDDAPDGALRTVRTAIADRHVVEIEYFSYGRDAVGLRRVDPWRVQQAEGHWYLQGRCHVRDAERLFRLDRMRSVVDTGMVFDPPVDLPPFRVFALDGTEGLVRLRLAPSAGWVLEYYPCEAIERRPDGTIDIVLAAGSSRWLERLLLRLGPDVEVLDAPDDLRDVGRHAARGLLDRYRN